MSNGQKHSASDYESEGRRFESCRARHKKRPVCRINADRSFLFSGALPAPYHNWYHKEAQEGFENM